MPCIWLRARTSKRRALLVTTIVRASSYQRLPKEPLASRGNYSEPSRNRPALLLAPRTQLMQAGRWSRTQHNGTTPAPSEYQKPSTGARVSTLASSPTTERAEKPEQTPDLPRKGRPASPSPRSSPKERHRSQTRRETARDDDGYSKEVTAPRRKAQSTPSTRKSRGSSRSKSSTPKGDRERLQWNDLADSNTEENGSSAEHDEQKVPFSRRSSRRS